MTMQGCRDIWGASAEASSHKEEQTSQGQGYSTEYELLGIRLSRRGITPARYIQYTDLC